MAARDAAGPDDALEVEGRRDGHGMECLDDSAGVAGVEADAAVGRREKACAAVKGGRGR